MAAWPMADGWPMATWPHGQDMADWPREVMATATTRPRVTGTATVRSDALAPPPLFIPQTQSIDFDGTTETMASAVPITLGYANVWTIAFWFNLNAALSNGNLYQIGINASPNRLQLFNRTTVGASPSIQMLLNNPAGSLIQNVAWTGLSLVNATWHHAVLQWNSLAGRAFYLDGVNQDPPGFTQNNNDAVLTDTARLIDVSGLANPPRMAGKGASLAIWNSILSSAEIVAVFNNRSINFPLLQNSGNYNSAANLQHWIELGKNPSPLLGADSGLATQVDLEAGATNITDADRVADVPAG